MLLNVATGLTACQFNAKYKFVAIAAIIIIVSYHTVF